jgi:hypothetical protein
MCATQRLRNAAIELGTEDYVGFWELLSVAREHWPAASGPELRLQVADCLRGLCRDGLIEFFSGDAFSGEERPVPCQKIDAELANASNWDPNSPLSAGHSRYLSTTKGEAAYYKNFPRGAG